MLCMCYKCDIPFYSNRKRFFCTKCDKYKGTKDEWVKLYCIFIKPIVNRINSFKLFKDTKLYISLPFKKYVDDILKDDHGKCIIWSDPITYTVVLFKVLYIQKQDKPPNIFKRMISKFFGIEYILERK